MGEKHSDLYWFSGIRGIGSPGCEPDETPLIKYHHAS
jgi:hypothetical protein